MLGFDLSIDRVRLQPTAGMRRRFRWQISTADGTVEGPLQKVIKETIKSLTKMTWVGFDEFSWGAE